MATAEMGTSARQEWALDNPWPWSFAGLALCLLAWAAGMVLDQTWWGLIFLGMLLSSAAVALRLNSSAPAFLEQLGQGYRRPLLYALALVFATMAAVTVVLFLIRVFGVDLGEWKPNGLFILMVVTAPLGFAAAKSCLGHARSGQAISDREEAAAMMMLAAVAAFCGRSALFNRELPTDWNTIQAFLRVGAFVALVAAALWVVSQALRRAVVSFLIVFHFGGICTAALSAPPRSWVVGQIWNRIYRPYLEFMYLNNAYHFYAPEPGPASYLWFRMYYEDAKGTRKYAHWVKLPDMDEKGRPRNAVALEYQRMLAITENTVPFDLPPPKFTMKDGKHDPAPWYLQRFVHSPLFVPEVQVLGKPEPQLKRTGPVVPFHPAFNQDDQYSRPNTNSRQLLESYARHVCRRPHPKYPDLVAKRVKIYRVIHMIPPVDPELDARDPIWYRPYYMGEYDRDGAGLDLGGIDDKGNPRSMDPFLFWMLPILRDGPGNTDPMKNYAALHAGDPDWLLVYDEANKRYRETSPEAIERDAKKLLDRQR